MFKKVPLNCCLLMKKFNIQIWKPGHYNVWFLELLDTDP